MDFNFCFRPDSEEPLISESLYNNFSSEVAIQLEKTTENADEKFTGMLRYRKTYLVKNEVVPTLEARCLFKITIECPISYFVDFCRL